jgi:integrator complex subunit 1
MEDASVERSWVDLPFFKPFLDVLLLSFGTLLPPPHLLPSDSSSSSSSLGGGGGAPSSPLPSSMGLEDINLLDEIKSLLSDNPLSPPDLSSTNPRFAPSTLSLVERSIVDFASDLLSKRSPEIPRNLLRSLSFACGLSSVRSFALPRLEQWIHSGKVGRLAQELLLHVAVNANCNTSADAECVTSLSKLRMKTKPLVHFYAVALREMVAENETNLRNVLIQIIYNELSPQRNPNNMPLLGMIFGGVGAARGVVADIFIDLLMKREDFHPALRLLFREIVRTARGQGQQQGGGELELMGFVQSLLKPRPVRFSIRRRP